MGPQEFQRVGVVFQRVGEPLFQKCMEDAVPERVLCVLSLLASVLLHVASSASAGLHYDAHCWCCKLPHLKCRENTVKTYCEKWLTGEELDETDTVSQLGE